MLIGQNRQLTKSDLLWDEKVVDYYEIGSCIRSLKAKNPLIKIGVYVGDFDDLTPADCVFLQLCRSRCDLFIVVLQSDYSLRLNKKTNRYTTEERAFRLGSMGYINYISVYDEEIPSLALDSIDSDLIFWGRTQDDNQKYSSIIQKEKLEKIEYPWFEERREGRFFSL